MQKKLMISLSIGFALGIIWIAGIRFLTYSPKVVHHHANFAVYINGQRQMFDNFTFYEEVQACQDDQAGNPRSRVHMHDNKNHVVHVHDHNSTWGHFFANLGYGLTDNVLEADDDVYIDGENENKLTFILNGEIITSAANRPINSEDVLLINYGPEDNTVLQERFQKIPQDAAELNQKDDPATCGGADEISWWERLKHSVGI